MSLLNSEAIKVLLINEDVLSEQGTIFSIWDMYTKNIEPDSSVGLIVDSLKTNVINHLDFSDADFNSCVSKYHKMIVDLDKSGVSSNALTNFLFTLDDSLSEYSINCKSKINTKINMNDSSKNPSYKDIAIILSTMSKNGLIDSTKVQSLLDKHYLDMVTVANRCMSLSDRSESPLEKNRGCGILKAPLLTLQDFGTDVSRVEDCINNLLNFDMDLFPNSPSEMKEMIFPSDTFDSQVLYRQDAYIPNLVNYGILTATSKYIEQSFYLDNETAIYLLSNVMRFIDNAMKEFNTSVTQVVTMVTGAMLLRYLKNNVDNEFDEDILKTCLSLKCHIKDTFKSFMNVNDSDDWVISPRISNMVRIPEELKDFVRNVDVECIDDSLFSDNYDFCDNLDAALNDILSSIEEAREMLEYSCSGKSSQVENVSDGGGTLSSLVENTGFEQVLFNHSQKLLQSVIETATNFHNELNCSLLDGDFEDAANRIALEVALLESMEENQLKYAKISDALTPIKETLERDVSTYEERVNLSSRGVVSYMESARDYVRNVLEDME